MLFYLFLSIRPKYYESFKMEYSIFFGVSKNFWGAKRGGTPKNFDFLLLLSQDNRLTWIYSLFTASYDDYSFQNLTKKMPAGVLPPLNRVKTYISRKHTYYAEHDVSLKCKICQEKFTISNRRKQKAKISIYVKSLWNPQDLIFVDIYMK